MEVAEEKDAAVDIDFALHRHLAALGRLPERHWIEPVDRDLVLDLRIEILVHVLPREVLDPILQRLALRVLDDPGDAEVEAAVARRDADELAFAERARALDRDQHRVE